MSEPDFPEYQARLNEGLCPVLTCHRRVRVGRLGCPAHWSSLPIQLRRLITAAWNNRTTNRRNPEAREEHEYWRKEAFRFWATARWRHPVEGLR